MSTAKELAAALTVRDFSNDKAAAAELLRLDALVVMTPRQALDCIKLLSAVEGWALSVKSELPVYLHEDLCKQIDVLEKINLGIKDEPASQTDF